MVGFGSSLRMARRPGWEAAYLDYETLKLLLSQIEAVYEEEGHRQRIDEDDDIRDYRDEIFREPDSDEAYSSAHDDKDEDNDTDGVAKALDQDSPSRSSRPFSLSYSHEASSSEEESQEGGCGAVGVSISSWTWDKKPSGEGKEVKKKKKKHQRSRSALTPLEEDTFYVNGPSNTKNDTFFMSAESNDEPQGGASIFNAPVRRTGENTSMLTPATPASNLYTFSGNQAITPPPPNMRRDNGDGHARQASSPPFVPSLTSQESSTTTSQFIQERQRDRLARRLKRKRIKAARRRRDRKVPHHLRVAHSKARAITERFLGLLRAETEKVLLFAQSRLGELADTAGSLRFPSMGDNDYGSRGGASHDLHPAGNYDYPLSDGGMHPSASSSDDDGPNAGHQGLYPWSDSSEDDEQSRGVASPRTGSTGLLTKRYQSEETIERSNRAHRSLHGGNRKSAAGDRGRPKYSDSVNSIRRQIAHFAELRSERPVFQRNDHILGEDMLLISAVEEADGYTAVAVEVLHALRFICVNLIAVRKICRKHDRLLMNRMLGGYYRCARSKRNQRYAHIEDAQTLGGLVARTSGDIYDAHPALIGQMTYYKLVGVYDRKIQKLANSRTVQVVSSCLAYALSEYEVSRLRADALTKLNSSLSATTPRRSGARPRTGRVQSFDSADGDGGPVSTESTISLTRLRFAVTSIFALREAARYKLNHYGAYLARSVLSFSGQSVIGDGLDGCSRETLDFLVSYNPDSVLLLDTHVLFDGLKNGRWTKLAAGDIMVSTLAAATTPVSLSGDVVMALLTQEEAIVAHSVSVLPGSKHSMFQRLMKGHILKMEDGAPSRSFSDLPDVSLPLNRMSCFLFMMNYFVVHSTTVTFVRGSGAPPAYTALVIGAPNLSALMVAGLHCGLLAREYIARRFPRYNVGLLRRFFVFSAGMGVVGNLIHGMAMIKASVPLAVLGRFVLGFSSLEIIHRQVVAGCLPPYVVAQSAQLVHSRVAGMFFGLLVGALAEIVPVVVELLDFRALQSTSWLMVLLWLIHFIRCSIRFRSIGGRAGELDSDDYEGAITPNGYDSQPSSESDALETPASVLYRSSSDITSHDAFNDAYGSMSAGGSQGVIPESGEVEANEFTLLRQGVSRKQRFRPIRTFVVRLRKLLMYNVGIPVCLVAITYSNYALEALFSSSPIIVCRYFGWKGWLAGLLLSCLTLVILPIYFLTEFIARRYEERTILKRSIYLIGAGQLLMMNWVSMFSLARHAPDLLNDTYNGMTHPYDGPVGVIQYPVGLTLTFIGLIALQGASLSLLSKVSPPRLRSVVIHGGTLAAVVGFVGRLAADLHIVAVEVSHKLINTDLVNSLIVPLCLVCWVILFFIRKHFFFLM